MPKPDEYISYYWVLLDAAKEYGFNKIAISSLTEDEHMGLDIFDIIQDIIDWIDENSNIKVILCCPDEKQKKRLLIVSK